MCTSFTLATALIRPGSAFRAIGYQQSFAIVQLGEWGLAQSRRRLMIQLARLDVVTFPCWPLPTHDVPEDERRRLKRTFDGLGADDEDVNRTVFHPISRVHEFASAPCEALSLADILGDLPKMHMAPGADDADDDDDAVSETPSRPVVWDDVGSRVVGYPTPLPLVEPVVVIVLDDSDEEVDEKVVVVAAPAVDGRPRLSDLDRGRYVRSARTAFQVRGNLLS